MHYYRDSRVTTHFTFGESIVYYDTDLIFTGIIDGRKFYIHWADVVGPIDFWMAVPLSEDQDAKIHDHGVKSEEMYSILQNSTEKYYIVTHGKDGLMNLVLYKVDHFQDDHLPTYGRDVTTPGLTK